jgi:hypothetical protein
VGLKRNVILPDSSNGYQYQSTKGGGGERKRPERDRHAHAAKLSRELKKAADADIAAKKRGGTYLRFNSSAGFELDPNSFDNATSRVQLVNVRSSGGDKPVVSATVYVPQRKAGFFERKVSEYADKGLATKKGNPKNQSLVESVDSVEPVTARSLWTGRGDEYPTDVAKWCEIWFGTRYGNVDELFGRFKIWCRDRQVDASDDYLVFPECLVVLAMLDAKDLDALFDEIGPMSEVRPLAEPNHEFLDFEPRFQGELSRDAAERVTPTDSDVSVCILDTGVNASHPLLNAAIRDEDDSVLAADDAWAPGDSAGHGTEMAGVVLYDDLRDSLGSTGLIRLHSHLESVKILPDTDGNSKRLYGSITADAMASIEIEHPERKRIFCMAVTDDSNDIDGSPSSWSAKVDGLAAGVGADDGYRRLCIVSAGNVDKNGFHDTRYSDHNVNSPVQDPAQAWNALTVGAYSDAVTISEPGFEGYSAMAPKGGLSPYSRTSVLWDDAWPIKPEICCDGGNLASDGYGNVLDSDDLSRLTTSNGLPERYLTTTRATSAATAQASWMASRILEAYPDLWPETVRALLVHSARWTDEMEREFDVEKGRKGSYRTLLRACGWGIPHIDYALGCLDSRVNLVVQGEIQPFDEEGRTNEMRVHELPWPREELLRLGEKRAELRVTLSYFIEPNPGDRGWGSKFRYQSCGLRFQVIDRRQSLEDFLKSVSKKMREGRGDNGGPTGAEDWVLGSDNRDVGSIISDFKVMSAADLADARYVVVYPTKGWWAFRKALGKVADKVRYALVVTIDTPEVESQLYNEVIAQVKMPVETVIEI